MPLTYFIIANVSKLHTRNWCFFFFAFCFVFLLTIFHWKNRRNIYDLCRNRIFNYVGHSRNGFWLKWRNVLFIFTYACFVSSSKCLRIDHCQRQGWKYSNKLIDDWMRCWHEYENMAIFCHFFGNMHLHYAMWTIEIGIQKNRNSSNSFIADAIVEILNPFSLCVNCCRACSVQPGRYTLIIDWHQSLMNAL